MTRTRFMRLQTLFNMAVIGRSYTEIYNKALSWGVTPSTASGYMKTLQGMLLQKSINLSDKNMKGRPNEFDDSEIVVGSGSDILSVNPKSEKNIPIWLRASSLRD